MAVVQSVAGIGTFVFCCGALWIAVLVGLVVWYWRRNPAQQVSAEAPEPVIQASVEHKSAADSDHGTDA